MKKLLPLMLAVGISVPAIADQWTGELLLGSTKHKADGYSESAVGFGVRGVYQFHENIAAEGSWQHFGSSDVDLTAFKFGAKGILPLDAQFSLNARAGLALWDSDFDDGTDMYLGVGGEMSLNRDMHLGLEYTWMEADNLDVNTLQLYLGMRF